MKDLPFADIDYHPVGSILRHRRRASHLFCGGCCDMRRAVIVINAIQLVGRTLGIFGSHYVASFLQSHSKSYLDALSQGDDAISELVNQNLPPADIAEGLFVIILVILVFGILCSISSIIGALRYNMYLVAANAIWLVLGTIVAGILIADELPVAWWLCFVADTLFIYPHIFLIYYIHTGIISKHTYPEEQSCCFV